MLNLDEIFAANAATRAELKAKAARAEAKRLEEAKAWEAECQKLRPALLSQAGAKASAWMQENLIMPHEFLKFEEFENGLTLHIKMEDGRGEEREWEVEFLFFFEGKSPNSLKVKWADASEDRKLMESYYDYDDY